jgi:hypothetical protein
MGHLVYTMGNQTWQVAPTIEETLDHVREGSNCAASLQHQRYLCCSSFILMLVIYLNLLLFMYAKFSWFEMSTKISCTTEKMWIHGN